MSGMKGRATLLVLGIPLLGFCAIQVKGVVRNSLAAGERPADRAAPREPMAASRAKSAAWLGEVRKAATVACQYRPAGAEDACADPAANAVVKSAANRSADLNDLDLFLSDVERPSFAGKLKGQYEKWLDEREGLKKDEQKITEWLARPQKFDSTAGAIKSLEEINSLITQYSTRSKFSDSAKAAVWRVKARLALADAMSSLADAQYQAAVKVKLPLEPGDNAAKTAVETHRALKRTIAALNTEVATAEEDRKLEPGLRAAVEAKGAVAEECSAREELLVLFARDDLFTNATGAPAWLKQVGAQYRKTKDEQVRRLIRQKVQEFCAAFIPELARLDDKVVLKGKELDRKDVVIKYQETLGGAVTRKPLSGELDGANEFNLEKKHPGSNTFVVHMGSEEYPRDLRPTEVSRAAVQFNAERKQLSDASTALKWNAKSVEELKKKCEPQKELVDQLQTTPGASVGKDPKIYTRLTGLASGISDSADLFEVGP